MVAITGNDLIALAGRHLHAGYDRFLSDIQVTETADETHAVELPRLFFKTADQQHVTVGLEFLLLGKVGGRWRVNCRGE